jgi:hypothetical protein
MIKKQFFERYGTDLHRCRPQRARAFHQAIHIAMSQQRCRAPTLAQMIDAG